MNIERLEIHDEIITNDSPLIRELFDTRVKFAAARPSHMRIQGLETLMYRILQRSEVKSADVMSSHGLRKFAISMMIKSGVDYNARECLVGHRHSRGLDIHYDRTSEEDRLAEYVKAIPLLTIAPTQRLEQENHDLKLTQAQEIAQLREEVRRFQKEILWTKDMAKGMGYSNDKMIEIMKDNQREFELMEPEVKSDHKRLVEKITDPKQKRQHLQECSYCRSGGRDY